MTRSLLIVLLCFLGSASYADEYSLDLAYEFAKELERASPKPHDGLSAREYQLVDIDKDGRVEVLERFNEFEEIAPGFLNLEIYPAFEWVNIYTYEKGEFQEATDRFGWYKIQRKSVYQLWLSLIENPEALSEDSQMLVNNNRDEFHSKLEELISKLR